MVACYGKNKNKLFFSNTEIYKTHGQLKNKEQREVEKERKASGTQCFN